MTAISKYRPEDYPYISYKESSSYRSHVSAPILLLISLLLSSCSGDSSRDPIGPRPPANPIPTAITISPKNLSFDALGQTSEISVTVHAQNGTVMAGASVTWTTSDPSIATVSSSGLATSIANGNATIKATAGSINGTSNVTVSQTAAIMELSDTVLTLSGLSDTIQVTAKIKDSNGNEIIGVPVIWETSDPTIATVSNSGLVNAVIGKNGTATITATSESLSKSLVVGVNTVSIVVASISPAIWTESQAATITGSGFSVNTPGNTITVDGLNAPITSATTTEIQIIVPNAGCKPSRETQLVVKVANDSITQTIGIKPKTIAELDIGNSVYTTNGNDCIHLASGNGSEKYLVSVVSVSETPSSLTAYKQSAIAGTSLANYDDEENVLVDDKVAFLEFPTMALRHTPSATPVLPQKLLRDVRYDSDILAQREAEIRRWETWYRNMDDMDLSRMGNQTIDAELRATFEGIVALNVGDTIKIKFPDIESDNMCKEYTDITTIVRHIGTDAIYMEDVDNPLVQSFTTSEYTEWDTDLSGKILPTLNSYFGEFNDEVPLGLDKEGRIGVIITKEVNKRSVLGFVFPGDLYPSQSCASSDYAEVFYGLAPDPNAVHGKARTKEFVTDFMPGLMTHEITHILQLTQRIFGGSSRKTNWEMEGGATFAEQLVGTFILEHGGSGQNLGVTEFQEGFYPGGWYYDWVVDLAFYFGYSNSGKVDNAPEQCTWLGQEDDGNTGPCLNKKRAIYGVPATLIRFILDHYGPNYSGGESKLMRDLTNSGQSGYRNLTALTGDDIGTLLTLFGTSLLADGRIGNMITSWDLYSIMQSLGSNSRLQPYTSSAVEPNINLSVRGGSASYLEWSPPNAHVPTSIRITTPEGGDLPNEMVMSIMRIQ